MATLGDETLKGTFLFMSCCPRWPSSTRFRNTCQRVQNPVQKYCLILFLVNRWNWLDWFFREAEREIAEKKADYDNPELDLDTMRTNFYKVRISKKKLLFLKLIRLRYFLRWQYRHNIPYFIEYSVQMSIVRTFIWQFYRNTLCMNKVGECYFPSIVRIQYFSILFN